MDSIQTILVLVVLYFIIRNAVEDGINRSLLVKDNINEPDDDIT